jgi:hypothetical protein
MRKAELDHLLEAAVAKALGVQVPHPRLKLAARSGRKAQGSAHGPIRHAA